MAVPNWVTPQFFGLVVVEFIGGTCWDWLKISCPNNVFPEELGKEDENKVLA